MPKLVSAFDQWANQAWPHKFRGVIHVHRIAGGVPSNKKVIEGWIKSRLGQDNTTLLQQQVAEVMVERGLPNTPEGYADGIEEVIKTANLNGFKRIDPGTRALEDYPDREGELYIEGRQLKAAIKEAALVAAGAGKLPVKGWGKTAKGLKGFVAEHIQINEDTLPLGVTQPTNIAQRFVQSRFGSSISYEEYCDDVEFEFTCATDWDFTEEQWAMIWLTGQEQGIGATRSQGYGRYVVKSWERL
jgi:hypothetical protein